MTSRESDSEEAVTVPPARPLPFRMADKVVVALFFIPLVLSTMPLGSVRDWAWAPMAVAMGLVAVLVALGFGAGKGFHVSESERRPLLALVACFGIFLAFAFLQMSSMAPASGSAWFYAAALRILGRAHAAVPDLAIDAARNTLLNCATCALIFMMARVICRDRGHARVLLVLVVASAVVIVAYALLMHVTTNSCYVGSYLKKQGPYDLMSRCLMSGTFVNSNTFACYVGMAIVAALALILGGRDREANRDYSGRDAGSFGSLLTGSRVALGVATFFLLGGLLLSASRAGVAATVAGVLILVLLLMRNRWRERPDLVRWFWIGMSILFVLGVVAGSAMAAKLMQGTDTSTRIAIWLTSIRAIALSPWLGWGLGSFADIFTILQPTSIIVPNNLAHSTPLETIVELGVLGAIPALALALLPWAVCLRGALRRAYRDRVRPAAAFAIAAVPFLHSTVDFSLQIPAIAYVASAVLGAGWAQAFRRPYSVRHRS